MFPFSQVRSSGGSVAASVTLPQDVFATSLFVGPGATQTDILIPGVDLTQGGMVWGKARTGATRNHEISDTVRGPSKGLYPNTTGAEGPNDIGSFGNGKFTIVNNTNNIAASGESVVTWAFRKAPKFFDIVTWTGDGTSNRQIPHSLGITPGMIIVKPRSSVGNWVVLHRSLGSGDFRNYQYLNLPNAQAGPSPTTSPSPPTTSTITVGTDTEVNGSGTTYVAYLFAHDPSADGLIQCGSFTLDANGQATVNLGWQPQFLLMKRTNTSDSWVLLDTTRGWKAGNDATLVPNSNIAEYNTTDFGSSTVGGFTSINQGNQNDPIIYMAIRAAYTPTPPIKAASYPQDVFNTTAINSPNAGGVNIETKVDMVGRGGLVWGKNRTSASYIHILTDTVRGPIKGLSSASSNAESTSDVSFYNNGFTLGLTDGNLNGTQNPHAFWSFGRATKFFDVVTWIGDGSSSRVIPHGLGVTPGMIVVKARNATQAWYAWHQNITGPNASWWRNYVSLNATQGASDWGDNTGLGAAPTTSGITIGSYINGNGTAYVAYVFAHDPDTTNGFIQCGSYTTNASGAATVTLGWRPQYLMIKSWTAGSNWFVFDTARGWDANSSSTPYLSPNINNAESTGSFGGPNDTGFTISGLGAANTGFIYMAIRAPIEVPPTTPPQNSFATTTYTGTGATQMITNGIDLATKGGLVWIKGRSFSGNNGFVDTVRGVDKTLYSNLTDAEYSATSTVTQFGSSGFTVGTSINHNQSNSTYSSWSFARQSKFFDIVTWTGDGTSGRSIPHGLGIVPGMIIIKCRNTSSTGWVVYHTSLGATKGLNLNATSAPVTASSFFNNTAPTTTNFTIGNDGWVNTSGTSYVAYVFAHDSSGGGMVQCGSFTVGASGSTSDINLGWKPQFLLIKGNDATSDWVIADTARGWTNGFKRLNPNTAAVEGDYQGVDYSTPTATGFTWNKATSSNYYPAGTVVYYMAIRNTTDTTIKPQNVYSTTTYTGNNAVQNINNGIDLATRGGMLWSKGRNSALPHSIVDTLRGVANTFTSADTVAEIPISAGVTGVTTSGYTLGADGSYQRVNYSNNSYVNWTFARAPKFFDIVTYAGDGTSNRSIPHSLGIVPGMILIKQRNNPGNWIVYHRSTGTGQYLILNSTAASASDASLVTATDASSFTLSSTIGATNTSGTTYVAYLFAHDTSATGIVQCGSFTEQAIGATPNIVLGWRPQFILHKNASSTSLWTIADTTRSWAENSQKLLRPNANTAEFDYNPTSAGTTANVGGPTSTGFSWAIDQSYYGSGAQVIYLAIRAPY